MAKDRATDINKRAFLTNLGGMSALAMLAQIMGPAANPALTVLAAQRPTTGGDVAFLNEAIKLEQQAINTYEAALRNDLIKDPRLNDTATDFVVDHTYHRDAISRLVRTKFNTSPIVIEKLGTFPIPKEVLNGKDADVLRYALTLEVIASKLYFEAINGKLATDEAKDLITSICAVENMHVAAYRTALLVVLKDKGLPEDKQIVPFSFFDQQPMPQIPNA